MKRLRKLTSDEFTETEIANFREEVAVMRYLSLSLSSLCLVHTVKGHVFVTASIPAAGANLSFRSIPHPNVLLLMGAWFSGNELLIGLSLSLSVYVFATEYSQ